MKVVYLFINNKAKRMQPISKDQTRDREAPLRLQGRIRYRFLVVTRSSFSENTETYVTSIFHCHWGGIDDGENGS